MGESLAASYECLGHRAGAALRSDRFDEYGSSAAVQLVSSELAFEILEISREELISVSEYIVWNASRLDALGSRDPDAVCQLIGPSVICTAHLEDVLVPCLKARDPCRHHAGLSTRSEHPELIYARHALADLLSQLELVFVEESRRRTAVLQKVDYCISYYRVVAADHDRSACLKQIIVFIAVYIIEFCPLGLPDCQWERIVEREIVLHSSRDVLLGLGRHGLGTRALCLEIVLNIVLKRIFLNTIHRAVSQLIKLLYHRFSIHIFIDRKSIVCHFLSPVFPSASGPASLSGRNEYIRLYYTPG